MEAWLAGWEEGGLKCPFGAVQAELGAEILRLPLHLQPYPCEPRPLPLPCPPPGLSSVPLFWAFLADYKNELADLATRSPENPKLEMLEQILQEQFGSSDGRRGILFTQTRQSAHSLLLWLQQQPGLQILDIRADLLIGAGNNSQNTHMTQVWALGKGAGVEGVPRGERVGTESSAQRYGGLILPRQRAENWGREVDTEIPSTEGFLHLGVPGGREAEACGSVGKEGRDVFRTEVQSSGGPLLEKNKS